MKNIKNKTAACFFVMLFAFTNIFAQKVTIDEVKKYFPTDYQKLRAANTEYVNFYCNDFSNNSEGNVPANILWVVNNYAKKGWPAAYAMRAHLRYLDDKYDKTLIAYLDSAYTSIDYLLNNIPYSDLQDNNVSEFLKYNFGLTNMIAGYIIRGITNNNNLNPELLMGSKKYYNYLKICLFTMKDNLNRNHTSQNSISETLLGEEGDRISIEGNFSDGFRFYDDDKLEMTIPDKEGDISFSSLFFDNGRDHCIDLYNLPSKWNLKYYNYNLAGKELYYYIEDIPIDSEFGDPFYLRLLALSEMNKYNNKDNNIINAYLYFKAAALNGSNDAYNRMGLLQQNYSTDKEFDFDGNEQTYLVNPLQAFNNFELGAEKGSVYAMRNLGIAYMLGTGTYQYMTEAKEILLKAKQAGVDIKWQEPYLSSPSPTSWTFSNKDGDEMIISLARGITYPLILRSGWFLPFDVKYRLKSTTGCKIFPYEEGNLKFLDGYSSCPLLPQGEGTHYMRFRVDRMQSVSGYFVVKMIDAQKNLLIEAKVPIHANWEKSFNYSQPGLEMAKNSSFEEIDFYNDKIYTKIDLSKLNFEKNLDTDTDYKYYCDIPFYVGEYISDAEDFIFVYQNEICMYSILDSTKKNLVKSYMNLENGMGHLGIYQTNLNLKEPINNEGVYYIRFLTNELFETDNEVRVYIAKLEKK